MATATSGGVTNYLRLTALLVDPGRDSLLCAFYYYLPRNQVQSFFSLSATKAKLTDLQRSHVLTNEQFTYLTQGNVNADSFDVGVIFNLLSYVVQGGCPEDKFLRNELDRLRTCRNEIYHRPSEDLSNEIFEELWMDIQDTLRNIVQHFLPNVERALKRKILQVKSRCTFDVESEECKRHVAQILTWCMTDLERFEKGIQMLQNTSQSQTQSTISADFMDARRPPDDQDMNTQLNSLADEFRSIAIQDSINRVQGDGQSRDGRNVSDTLQVLIHEVSTIRQCVERVQRRLLPTVTRGQPAKPKPQQTPPNPHAMTDKEIDNLSRMIGGEFQQLMIYMDYTEKQKFHLQQAYRDDTQQQIYEMLKAWHDVVIKCGEKPRHLLAAAFATIDNYSMAFDLVPEHELNTNLEARPHTVTCIQKIQFKSAPTSRPVFFQAAPNSVNIVSSSLSLEKGSSISFTGDSSGSESSTPRSLSAADLSALARGQDGVFFFAGPNSLNVADGAHVTLKPYASVALGPGINLPSPDVLTEGLEEQMDTSIAASSSAGNLKKMHNSLVGQQLAGTLTEMMKSVGALQDADGRVYGTAFLVGPSHCHVITADHVVQEIVDPDKTGTECLELLGHVYVNFNSSTSVLFQNNNIFQVDGTVDLVRNSTLDYAILKLATSTPFHHLPLRKDPLPLEIQNVSLIGYGNPDEQGKYLDDICNIISNNDQRVRDAMIHVQRFSDKYKSVLNVGNSRLVDQGYVGYDESSKFLVNCSLEHGASGGPAIAALGTHTVQVVGVLTRGMPEFYYHLPSHVQMEFNHAGKYRYEYRFEMATRMTDIYHDLRRRNEGLARTVFA